MKLIVGLGNPGRDYINSRHNVGFSVVGELAKANKFSFKKCAGSCSLSAKGRINGYSAALAMPLTFMNLSGVCVKPLLEKYKIEPKDLLVICDDLDLELGRLKVRPCGSFGGHRGLKSIIDALGTQEFSRMRIGIGRPRRYVDAADYVLSAFTSNEKKQIKEIIQKAVDCCHMWLAEGVTACMNTYNKRSG